MDGDCKSSLISSAVKLAALSAGAYLCYKMARNLITFCAVFDAPAPRAERACTDELEEIVAE